MLLNNLHHISNQTSMKRYCFFLAFFFSAFFLRAQNIPSADEVLKTAYQKAARENKNVFLLFRASWCGWCRAMDSSMKDPSVQAYFDKNYVITHLTVYERDDKKLLENTGAEKFLEAHDGANKGIPFWLILDPGGKTLADSQKEPGKNTGCPATKEEVAHLLTVLEKTSTITAAEKSALEKRFIRNQ